MARLPPLLRGDAAVFDDRWEKSAAGLIAVARALRRHDAAVAGTREFLAVYDEVVGLPAPVFTRVWRDPFAYFWLHRAYELVGAALSGERWPAAVDEHCRALDAPTPALALARHLEQFKGLALAMHFLAGASQTFATPLTVTLPFVLPGTGLYLDGRESVAIVGTSSGCLDVTGSGGEIPPSRRLAVDASVSQGEEDGVRLVRSAVARYGRCALALQPYALTGPGLDFAAAAVTAGLDYQETHRTLVERALTLVARYDPATFAVLAEVTQVVALKPAGAGGYTNVSHSDLPGAFILGVMHHPFELADAIVHEHYHNRLFCIEEAGSFFDPAQDALTDERYYSPWRDEPRPLRGVLHALFVYTPVCEFWLAVYGDRERQADVSDYAMDRIIRIPAQLDLAINALQAHARFTALGDQLFAELREARAAIAARVERECLPADAPALRCAVDGSIHRERSLADDRRLSVLQAVDEHCRRYTGGEATGGIG